MFYYVVSDRYDSKFHAKGVIDPLFTALLRNANNENFIPFTNDVDLKDAKFDQVSFVVFLVHEATF